MRIAIVLTYYILMAWILDKYSQASHEDLKYLIARVFLINTSAKVNLLKLNEVRKAVGGLT